MKKVIFFTLSGRFAHFRFPFTSPNFLKKTFSVPPKTAVYGIIGCILGLNGFQQYEEGQPEYFAKLNHIPLSICITKIPSKTLIVYNSLNSFAKNISENPIVNIHEEILLNPEYRIGLLLDESIEIDLKLIKLFQDSFLSSKYHLYLGKNEFFANISNVSNYSGNDFSLVNLNIVEHIESIIPSEFIDLSIPYDNLIYVSFSKNISFIDKKLKTELCEVVYFSDKETKNNIEFTKETELLKVGEKYYYLF